MNKKLTLEELKSLVFQENQATKRNRDRLFKLAKAENDIETIKRLRDEFGFKSAKIYLDKLDNLSLEDAINNEDFDNLKKLVKDGVSLSNVDIFDLLEKNYDFKFIQILIENGINLNKKTMIYVPIFEFESFISTLHYVTLKNNIQLIQLLINHNVDIDIQDSMGLTPLMYAVWKGNLDTTQLLIKYKANLDAKDILGVTPLIRASCEGYEDIVKVLIKSGANIHAKDNNGGTAIEDAYFNKHYKIVDLLIKAGARLNNIDEFRHNQELKDMNNILHSYFEKVNATISSAFIAEKFILEELDAARNGNDEAKEWAKNSGYKEYQYLNTQGKSLPEVDGPNGPQQTMRRLLMPYFLNDFENEEISNQVASMTREILNKVMKYHSLGKYAHSEKQLILENQTHITIYSDDKYIEFGNSKFEKIYLNKYFNLELQKYIEINENMVLIYKVNYNKKEIEKFKILYEKELTTEMMIEEAIEDRNIQLLKKALAQEVDISEFNIIFFILEDYDVNFIQLLIENNIQLDLSDQNGSTPLHVAVELHNIEIVKLLLKFKVDCSKEKNDGNTALTLACNYNGCNNNNEDTNIIKLLLGHITKVNAFEAICLTSQFYNPEIAKLASPLLVEDKRRNYKTTILMETIMIETIMCEIASLDTYKAQNESIQRLLIICGNLLKGNVDLEFEDDGINVFKQVANIGIPELIDLINNYRYRNTHKQSSVIHFDKYTITLISDKILFTDINECKVNELKKLSKNKYRNENGDVFTLTHERVFKESFSGDKIQYKVQSYEGKIIDIDSNHNPISLSRILKKFSSSEKLKYSNHTWDTSLDYDNFMKGLKEGFEEISSDLKLLSSTLYDDINAFLFSANQDIIGWSSLIVKEAIQNNKLPSSIQLDNFEFKTFTDAIDNFKSLFVVKQNDRKLKLLKKFTKIRKELKEESLLEIKLNLDDLKENKIDKFFTDAQRLEKALKLILIDINENLKENTKEVIIEANVKEESIVELKIIHVASKNSTSADVLKETINKNGGNFKSIYDNLISVCDWSIDTICSDGKRYKIDYLYPELKNNEPICTQIDDTPKGFTHILRFYI